MPLRAPESVGFRPRWVTSVGKCEARRWVACDTHDTKQAPGRLLALGPRRLTRPGVPSRRRWAEVASKKSSVSARPAASPRPAGAVTLLGPLWPPLWPLPGAPGPGAPGSRRLSVSQPWLLPRSALPRGLVSPGPGRRRREDGRPPLSLPPREGPGLWAGSCASRHLLPGSLAGVSLSQGPGT